MSTADAPTRSADAFLDAALRDDASLPTLTEASAVHVLARARHHGVAGLLAARPEILALLPEAVRVGLTAQARLDAVWELRHRHLICQVIEALAAAGVSAVVLKGTALAYRVYPSPALRQRGDTDLLVQSTRAADARGILEAQGFAREMNSTIGFGADVLRQELWTCRPADGSRQAIDVHWGVMSAWSLARLFDSEAVMSRAVPLPRLSPSARGIGPRDALYHACLHRGVHIRSPYYVGSEVLTGGDRLIWLYDIHLIAPTLGTEDWQTFIRGAVQDGSADLCHDALDQVNRRLGTPIPLEALASLERAIVHDGPSAYFSRNSSAQRLQADVASVPGLRAKLAFLNWVFFPSRAYMVAKYPDMARYPVVVLHLRRALDRLRGGRGAQGGP